MPAPQVLDDRPPSLDRAGEALLAGEVVVIPTDTVYGVATLARRPGAADHLFALKGRPRGVPIAVLVADPDRVHELVESLPTWAQELIQRHWPGPLTLVGRRRTGVALDLGEPEATIGVRCPDHDFVRALSGRVGPLATTSANVHGSPTPPTAAGVVEQLELGSGAVVIDGGRCEGLASTVLDVTGDAPAVLRVGALSLADLGLDR